MVQQHPNEIKRVVRTAFSELGLTGSELANLDESLLVQDGRYFGRSYLAGKYMAMWMIDVHLIQFYGPEGEMLRTIDLAANKQRRHAA